MKENDDMKKALEVLAICFFIAGISKLVVTALTILKENEVD